jgi:DedD protein
MASYFDDDEEREREEPRQDTELTLSWGALLGMGFGLLAICGLCFGLGYMAGHRSPAPAPTASLPQSNAPDQEPLQGSGSVPKPTASEEAPAPGAAQADNSATAAAPDSGGNPEPAAASPPQAAQGATPGGTTTSAPMSPPPAQPQVRPALGGTATASVPNQAAPGMRPALPSATALMVQVAAVKNDEDAEVLTNALRRRGYPVIARREPADGLIHVRIGPFPTHEEANQWRMKLLGDGYNAIVQP